MARPMTRPERRRGSARGTRLTWLAALGFLWRLLLAFVKLSLLGLELATLAGLLVYNLYLRDLIVGLDQLPALLGRHRPAETTQIYARDGETLLYELVDPSGGRRTVVPFERIPQTLKDATVAVEDAGFYQNPGVDLRGIIRALIMNYRSQSVVSGASTITQQLVRNVLLPPEERNVISFDRKIREAFLAYRVSREYSKAQILGLYLNEVYYGSQAYGVEAAAQSYFGKHVWDLTPAEATLLAGLPQAPTRIDPLVNFAGAKERQQVTLDLMVKYGYLTPQQAAAIAAAPIRFAPRTSNLIAPHFVYYVKQLLEERYGPEVLYRGGLRVVTSLDLYWQAEAQRIVAQRVAELRRRNATNAAVVLLSPDNQILAMVGSADFNDPSIDGQVNVALAARQPGSALKPIVYAAALQQGWTPATVIWDVPTVFKTPDGASYAPRNYDDSWHGPQRLRMALANSLNIPAVKAVEYVGVERFVEQAHALGISTLNDASVYGLPLVLGAGEVRLLDLTNVYSTFRNAGRFREPLAILRVGNSRGQVLERADPSEGRPVLGPNSEQIAYQITDILSDNEARWYMFGRGNVMELPDDRPAAVKTGTSNEWRDSWALGYTPDVTVGVWVGNSDNSRMQEVAGVNGAGLIWRDLMVAYHAGRPVRSFSKPEGLVEAPICASTGGLASDACGNQLKELFVAGTEPKTPNVQVVRVQVAGDGFCLPASYTPPDEIREATFTAYPPEFRDWAIKAGIPQPPTSPCPPPAVPPDQAFALIRRPFANSVITDTVVYVDGVSRGSYALEYGAGRDPQEWNTIGQGLSSVNGLLGVWRLEALPPGDYTLRLLVITPDGVPIESRATVTVRR